MPRQNLDYVENIIHKKTILQVIPAVESQELSKYLFKLKSLNQESGEKQILLLDKKMSLAEGVDLKKYFLKITSRNPLQLLINFIKLKKIIKENNIRAINLISNKSSLLFVYLARKLKLRLSFTVCSNELPGKRICAYVDEIITTSNFMKNKIDISGRNKVVVITEKITNIFAKRNISKERIVELAQKLYLPTDAPIILATNKMDYRYGNSILIEAISKLPKNSVTCIIYARETEMHYLEYLRLMLIEKDLSDRVIIVSGAIDLPALFALADLFVIAATLYDYNMSINLMEAISAEKNIIAANIGDFNEILDNEFPKNLLLLENIENLHEYIALFLQNYNSKAKNADFVLADI